MTVPRAEARSETMSAAVAALAGGAAWVATIHLALGISVAALAATPLLVAAAAYGLGYELGDGGMAASLFLLLALGGVFLSAMLAIDGAPGAGLGLAFGTAPALIAAPCAYAGGARREG